MRGGNVRVSGGNVRFRAFFKTETILSETGKSKLTNTETVIGKKKLYCIIRYFLIGLLVDKDNLINYQLVINYRLLTNTSIGYGTGIWNTEEYLEIFLGIPEIEGRQ